WDSQGSLYEKITFAKFELLIDFLKDIKEEGIKQPLEQNHEIATYLPKRKDDDGLLSIENDLESIYNHIRSFDPWTGAYFLIDKKKIRLRSVIPVTKFLESKVTDKELIISRTTKGKIKSLIISSITDVVEQPTQFD